MTLSGDLSWCAVCHEGEPLVCAKCACRPVGGEDPIEGLDVSPEIRNCLHAIKAEVEASYQEHIEELEGKLAAIGDFLTAERIPDDRPDGRQVMIPPTDRYRLMKIEEVLKEEKT